MSSNEPTPDDALVGQPHPAEKMAAPEHPGVSTVPKTAVGIAPIVLVGIAMWLVALAVTLVVPSLHTGSRHWWPWCCAVGAVLGAAGYGYVRRGRGNAADA